MRVPEYSCFSSFLFHSINGQTTVTVFQILKKKKKSKSHFSMYLLVSHMQKDSFSALIYIKLNVKANSRILIRTYLFTVLSYILIKYPKIYRYLEKAENFKKKAIKT